jgi:lipoprotein-releasing system permease protein
MSRCARWTTWSRRPRCPQPGTTVLTQTQPRAQRLRSVANWQALVPLLEPCRRGRGVAHGRRRGLALRGEATQVIALWAWSWTATTASWACAVQGGGRQARLEPGEAIIGRELAVRPGRARGRPADGADRHGQRVVRVTALVDLGVRDLNRRTVIVPLRAAQSLLGLPGGATSLDLALPTSGPRRPGRRLRAQLPYKVESWQETNAQLVSALNAQSVSTGLIRGVVLVVVVLGIASVLVVSVVQKRREIGILRAMGATRGQMLRVFLVQGAVVGALGSVLGVVLAVALIWAVHHLRARLGRPAAVCHHAAPALALQVALMATVCGVLAAVAPARRAAAHGPGAGHPDVTPWWQPALIELDGMCARRYNLGLPNEAEVLHGI